MSSERETDLSEIRIIDLSQAIGGAYCAMLFAGCGADVIAVEPPEGNPLRRRGPFLGSEEMETGAGWLYVGAGKRSVTLDISDHRGVELLASLIEGAAAVIESFPPGHLDGLGIGFVEMRRRKRRIVLASVIPSRRDDTAADYRAGVEAFAATAIAVHAADIQDVPQHIEIDGDSFAQWEAEASVESPPSPLTARLLRIQHPSAGQIFLPPAPFRSNKLGWAPGPAPLLGQHTESVLLGELGLAAEGLAQLRADKVV